ncbi:redoxin family protein [Rhodocaloribacter sp.]
MSAVPPIVAAGHGRVWIVLLALVLGAAAPVRAQRTPLPIGAKMPMADHILVGLDGRRTTLADTLGERGAVILFWSNTCPWTKNYEKRVRTLAERASEIGVRFVLVNPNDPRAFPRETPPEARKRSLARAPGVAYLFDEGSVLARTFGATRTPEAFVFDADTTLVYSGAIDDSPRSEKNVERAYLSEVLEALRGGKPVEVDRTKPFGCLIKYER